MENKKMKMKIRNLPGSDAHATVNILQVVFVIKESIKNHKIIQLLDLIVETCS